MAMLISNSDVQELSTQLANGFCGTGRELFSLLGRGNASRKEVEQTWALLSAMNVCSLTMPKQYLRIHKSTGEAHISPSVARRFADFTIIGSYALPSIAKYTQLEKRVEKISDDKEKLALEIAQRFEGRLLEKYASAAFCVLLAGDVTYRMSSDAPRESSNGYLMRGSDIDLVVLVEDGDVRSYAQQLLLREKSILLQPPYREELDVVVKMQDEVRRQSACNSFQDQIACKILLESQFLCGDPSLASHSLDVLEREGAVGFIAQRFAQGRARRRVYEQELIEVVRGLL